MPTEHNVFRRSDGDWVLRYKADANCWKQHRLGAHRDDRAALAAGKTWLAQHAASGSLPAATKTVAECAALWLAHRREKCERGEIAGSTIRDNEDQLNTHILPKFGKTPIGRLKPQVVGAWVAEIRESLSTSRCSNIVSTFSALYQHARSKEWVRAEANLLAHPAVRSEVPTVRTETEDAVVFTLATAQRLIVAPADEQRRLRYLLAFLSGLRDGEIAGIQVADLALNDETPTVRIRKALALREQRGEHATTRAPKTHESKRIVPLHPEAVIGLRWWLDRWEMYTGEALTPDSPLFPSPKTAKAWRPKSAEHMRDDLAALGLPTTNENGDAFDFHATRRSFNTWLTEAGVAKDIRDRILGHTGGSTGERHYTGTLLATMHEAIARVPLRWAASASLLMVTLSVVCGAYAEQCEAVKSGVISNDLRNRCSTTELRRPTAVCASIECSRTWCAPGAISPEPTRTLVNSDQSATVSRGVRSRRGEREKAARRAFKAGRKVARALRLARDLAIDGVTSWSPDERERQVVALLASLVPKVTGGFDARWLA